MTSSSAAKKAYYGYPQVREIALGDWDYFPKSYGVEKKNEIELNDFFSKPEKKEHLKTSRNDIARRRKCVFNCSIIILAFSLLMAVVFRYSLIAQMHIDSEKSISSIDVLTEEVEQLTEKVNASRNINVVFNRAKDLGMDYGELNNIEYIELNYSDIE